MGIMKRITSIFTSLPRKRKMLLVTLFVVAALVVLALPLVERARQYHAIYTEYHAHFYAEYLKTIPDYQAEYYAKYYASYYAEYYTSPSYRAALQYALPEYSEASLRYPPSPISGLSTGSAGLAYIRQFEGFRGIPYRDPIGKMTVGYGHLVRKGEYFDGVTRDHGEQLMRQDVLLAEAVVKRHVRVPLSDSQFDALVSLVYNIGEGNFRKSTLVKKLNRGNYKAAADEFLEWEYAGGRRFDGLAQRRRAERKLFLS